MMRLRRQNFSILLVIFTALIWPLVARAVSCTTESEMTQAQRNVYEQAARSLGTQIQAGNNAAVRANTVAAIAAQFNSMAGSIERVSPQIQKATLTVDALYNLNALDVKADASQNAGTDQAQFFCSIPNSTLLVTVTIPQLPQGNYVLALLHATGVAQPQQLTLLLQNDPKGSAEWRLAGLYVRPMTAAGHDGVWFWKQARDFAVKKQLWNSYFYYQTAAFLLNPVQFLSSPNLEKLEREAQGVKPPDLPGKDPLAVKAGGESLEITGLRTESFGGGLDLVVDYKAQNVTGPVDTRAQIVELMKALLALHPELRAGFHGLWVYATYNNGQQFAIELPMNQI
jgi:hypothetical protein